MNKTDNASEVGKHKFEVAGLGLAPFRFVGMSENYITYPDGTGKAGGTCDYCGNGIRFECVVLSRDGKRFKVGSDCIAKVGDEGILRAYKNSPEVRAHKRKLAAAKDAKVSAELVALLAAKEAEYRALPHPYGFINRETGAPLSKWDYVQFSLKGCGASGRAAWLKTLKRQAAPAA
jgi:hypothetical protein